ncbi:NRAMP family divalent metal transporter [Alteromonas gilva]|uniref:Divalent metal cation transporter n=1 Tax=Alteromonas gilva TaxID=2987522 RepID=A0ABT5L0X6_9ALTE|nr:divalent metal cation transporter [Alteromonas gilva]MDC8830537.1 divalent metal cation transporter [Alteromonas gilva]
MATAAIGGSHLVASTQAGAQFGWQLVWLILAVNLFKYPFFRAGVSYTISSRKTLQQGYLEMGKPYLIMSFALNGISSFVNAAALLLFAASLLGYFVPFDLALPWLAGILLVSILAILIGGHYHSLNHVAKIIMVALVVATIAAAFIAWQQGPVAPDNFTSPSPWTLASIGFLVVTMGWMPAPIEISGITSLWLKQQCNEQAVTPKSALFDFNLGYFVTLLLALLFLSLGSLVLHGGEHELASAGIGFSHQLVALYASTIGDWSRYLIAVIAFLCIFGSALTVYDGYSRALAECYTLLKGKQDISDTVFTTWLIMVAIASFAMVLFFKAALLAMLGFAMTLAFITTPVFAWLNYRLVNRQAIDEQVRGGALLLWLSRAGLAYLFGFLIVFIIWKWFL